MLRISTQSLFEIGGARISELQSGLARTQQQVASGRRMLSPSDDPVAAAQALEVSQSQSVNAQYGVNRQYAMNSLSSVEGTLSSVTSLLQDVKTIALAAGNPTIGDAERGNLATELRGRFNDLLGMANSRDEVGNYLFSGFQTNTPAFVESAPGVVTYQGDQGQRMVQVDASRQLAVTVTGESVFQNGTQDVFQTLNDLITLLQTPGAPGLAAGLTAANDNLGQSLDNVLAVRASVGTNMQTLDFFDVAGQNRDLQYSQVLSDLQDLDYAKAVTQLSQQQFMLEAAQKSFVKTSGLSLFNFI
jgi:flagellar hook-associated protein 3 FlgL